MCTGAEFLLAAGTTAGAASSLYRGFAGSAAGKMSADIARMNAELMRTNAEIARKKGDLAIARSAFDQARSGAAVDRVIGAQRARFVNANLDPASGSPLLALMHSAAEGEVDRQLIVNRGQLEAAGAMVDAANALSGAASQEWSAVAAGRRATQELVAGVLGAGTAVLSGASKWPGLSSGAASSSSAGYIDPFRNSFLLNQPEDI